MHQIKLLNIQHFVAILSIVAMAAGIWLRISAIGYSDFQGDEVAAQNFLFDERTFFQFLSTRTIGPGQYIVAKLAHLPLNTTKDIEAYIRIPFALANIVSMYFVFLLTKHIYSRHAAFVASALVSMSGLLIAFARIVQYQSFILMLATATVYYFARYMGENSKKFLLASALTSSIGILFHYDALSFVLPIMFVLAVKRKFSDLFYFSFTAFLVPIFMYLAIFTSPTGKSTLFYLISERIGDEVGYDSLYYSIKLLKLYHPKEFLLIVLGGLLATIFWIYQWIDRKLLASVLLLVFVIACVLRILFVQQYPVLISIAVLSLCIFSLGALIQKQDKIDKLDLVVFWFLFSFGVYAVLITKPLTHIYTFMYPLMILIAIATARFMYTQMALVILMFIATFSFNYQAFINTSPEYPWSDKSYVFGKMTSELSAQKEIKGVFGFPYNRNWEQIKDVLTNYKDVTYSSNEKYRLTKYYIRNLKYSESDPDVFIYIHKPQSLSNYVPIEHHKVLEHTGFSIYYKDSRVNDMGSSTKF